MYTISSIVEDVQRGILAYNMVETCFTYRIVYFINENGKGRKCYADTPYGNLRRSLENIIRGNLSTTNSVVISAVTVWKNGGGCFSVEQVVRIWFRRIFSADCWRKRERI